MPLTITDNFKYQVQQDPNYPDGIGWLYDLKEAYWGLKTFANRYYFLRPHPSIEGWWQIGAYVGCGYDGASGYPDTAHSMEGTLGHDILHWLIDKGAIPTGCNPLIDRELKNIIIERGHPPWYGGKRALRFIARYMSFATRFVWQKAGKGRKHIRYTRMGKEVFYK